MINQIFLPAPTNSANFLKIGCVDDFLTYHKQKTANANHKTLILFKCQK